jgi:hypothetical protein
MADGDGSCCDVDYRILWMFRAKEKTCLMKSSIGWCCDGGSRYESRLQRPIILDKRMLVVSQISKMSQEEG